MNDPTILGLTTLAIPIVTIVARPRGTMTEGLAGMMTGDMMIGGTMIGGMTVTTTAVTMTVATKS